MRQRIRPLVGARWAPGHHGNKRACDLITGQASADHLGHQCSQAPGKTDPPSHLILSQTSAGNPVKSRAGERSPAVRSAVVLLSSTGFGGLGERFQTAASLVGMAPPTDDELLLLETVDLEPLRRSAAASMRPVLSDEATKR